MENQFVIIVAGGQGIRMGSVIPKQFINLNGLPVLMTTLLKFVSYNSLIKIILVLPNEHFNTWQNLCEQYNFNIKHLIVEGGNTRFQSVKNGLEALNDEGLIAVHDGVRPLVTVNLIKKCFDEADINGNAIPCTLVNETVREIIADNNHQLNRSNLRLIQTPQVFKSNIIKQAYELPFSSEFTDDASVIERTGHKINLVDGDIFNIKITTLTDLQIAEYILNKCKENEEL